MEIQQLHDQLPHTEKWWEHYANKFLLIVIVLIAVNESSYSQNGFPNYYAYMALNSKADSLYRVKDYLNAAQFYSEAANINVEKAFGFDYADVHYNAACCYALAGKKKQAFQHLNTLATRCKYTGYESLFADSDLSSLHKDKEWENIIALVKANQSAEEKQKNIFTERTTYSGNSKEVLFQPHTKTVKEYLDNDSLPFLSINYGIYRIYFRGNSYAASHLPEVKAQLSEALQKVLGICQASEYNHGINIILVDSARETQELTGFYIHGGMSMPEVQSVLVVYNEGNQNPFSHELFHYISNDLWGMYSSRILQEGGAVYTECGNRTVIDSVTAAIFKEQKMFSLDDLINKFDDIAREDEIIAYFEGASVFKYLYENYGAEKMKQLWTEGFEKFELIYGKSLSDFENEWKGYILSLPVPDKYDWTNAALHRC